MKCCFVSIWFICSLPNFWTFKKITTVISVFNASDILPLLIPATTVVDSFVWVLIHSRLIAFSRYEAMSAQELALIRQDGMVMERRDNACRVVLTSGRWSLMDECFSHLILERKILRSILQPLEESPSGRKPQAGTVTMDTYYSFFSSHHQSLPSLIPPSWYFTPARSSGSGSACACGESQEV